MSEKIKVLVQATILFIITALLIWHAVNWHVTGMHLQMFDWIGTNKTYIAVLYNVGLMLLTGMALGFLTDRIATLLSHGKEGTNNH